MHLSKERQTLAAVCILLLWCILLIGLRIFMSVDGLAIGLLWNLFLATIPLLMSAGFQSALSTRKNVVAGLCFIGWLLFFPNAPYILTDLIHLGPRPGVPLWFLLAMLLSCAGTGTLLGYLSLLTIHEAIEQRFSSAAGWLVAGGSLMLCGFGIYIGRFLRWNSWNALTDPLALVRSVLTQFVDPGPHPHPVGVTLIFGVGLIVGYLALRAIATPARAA